MNLQEKIAQELKEAMKSKNAVALEALRAIKSEILLANTSGTELTQEGEHKILQRLVKQRKESAELYQSQKREDLAQREIEQAEIIEQFLPQQMTPEQIKEEIEKIIEKTGATSIKEMGKVMGVATKQMAGKADAKVISDMVKQMLETK